MRKSTQKIVLTLILMLAIIVIAIVGFSLTDGTNNISVSVDETKVVIVRDVDDEKLIHIKLAMADGVNENTNETVKNAASIASFQIGLNVDVEQTDKVQFEFNEKLENKSTKKLAEYNYNKEGDEKLYIYYVGTEELNDAKSSDSLEVGTIRLNIDDNAAESSINITPIEGFSTAASIGHLETPFDSVDSVQYIVNRPENESPDIDDNTVNNTVDDGNTSTDNNTTGGSGTTGGKNEVNQNTSGNNSGDSSKNNENDGKDSIVDKVITSMKTGANHSIVRVLIALAVLIVVALVLIYTKAMTVRKHAKH